MRARLTRRRIVRRPTPRGPGVGPLDRAVGGTPLVRLSRLVRPGQGEVWVKLEGANPGGSVKDRPALAIIRAAEAAGVLDGDRVLLDASSGNTGIAYAMLCAARGLACEICIPAHASAERMRLLRAYGARLVLTDPSEGSDGAIREARRRAEEDPDRYFYANQYDNPANPRAHYETTGPEIWRQTGGRLTHFVAILGTGGTFAGVGRRLREWKPEVRLVAVQPASPFHGIEGAKHMATARVPGVWDPTLQDAVVEIRTEEAQATALGLARREGLFAGPSGGANVAAALRLAGEVGPAGVIVTLLPDGGSRYLDDAWLQGDADGGPGGPG